MREDDLVVTTMGKAQKKSFKVSCMKQGYTMSAAVKWLAEQVVQGKIKLPKEAT